MLEIMYSPEDVGKEVVNSHGKLTKESEQLVVSALLPCLSYIGTKIFCIRSCQDMINNKSIWTSYIEDWRKSWKDGDFEKACSFYPKILYYESLNSFIEAMKSGDKRVDEVRDILTNHRHNHQNRCDRHIYCVFQLPVRKSCTRGQGMMIS